MFFPRKIVSRLGSQLCAASLMLSLPACEEDTEEATDTKADSDDASGSQDSDVNEDDSDSEATASATTSDESNADDLSTVGSEEQQTPAADDVPTGLSTNCANLYPIACELGCTNDPVVGYTSQCEWAMNDDCGLCAEAIRGVASMQDYCGWEEIPEAVECE